MMRVCRQEMLEATIKNAKQSVQLKFQERYKICILYDEPIKS